LEGGLPERRIRDMLHRAKVEGNVEPIVDLFGWKNGARADPSVAQYASPFPNSEYIFMDLEMMVVDFRGFDELAMYHPRYANVVGKYFPVFWNGSDCWMAVDLEPSNQSQVVLIEGQLENITRPLYDSFHEFLKDAIRANEANDKLTCFK